MKTNIFTILLLLTTLFTFTLQTDIPEEEGVLVLGNDNFDQAIKDNEFVLVEFYAPWCGHCKKLAPEYAIAAQALKKDNIALAKVDTTVHKELGTRFGVEGYPTLKLFSSGTPSDYNGGRTGPEIISWMKKKTGPATKVLKTKEEVEAFNKENDVALVYFGDDSAHSEIYNKVARSLDDVVFGVASKDLATHFNATEGKVSLFKKFDELQNHLHEDLSEESIKKFISTHGSPLVMGFDEKSAQLVFGKNTPGLFLYRDKNAENTESLDKTVKELAQKLKGKIQVVITDIKEGLETRLAEYIGIKSEDLPTVRIHDTRQDLKKYTLAQDLTSENISKFVEDWIAGNLKASLKSEEIPATQPDNVYTLVGKNFNDIVLDPTKDVLVEFYAPWCGHCKKLTPIYEELATKLKANKNLVIAKMDSTANEVDGVSVQGFPTIKFWPKGDKTKVIDFEGDRTVEGFEKFFEKHGIATTGHAAADKDDL